jgi:hypothetical protein
MTTTTINLPSGFVSDILNNANALFSSFSGYITLIIGIILAAVVIEILIGVLRR